MPQTIIDLLQILTVRTLIDFAEKFDILILDSECRIESIVRHVECAWSDWLYIFICNCELKYITHSITLTVFFISCFCLRHIEYNLEQEVVTGAVYYQNIIFAITVQKLFNICRKLEKNILLIKFNF